MDVTELGLPLEPPDRQKGGQRSGELDGKDQQRSGRRTWEPLEGEERGHKDLSRHEDLPDVGRGALVSLWSDAEHGSVTNYCRQGGEGHDDRNQGTRVSP